MSDERGFTLVEMLTVLTIIMVSTIFMMRSFSRARVDLDQARSIVTEAIRDAQSRAFTSAQLNGSHRCGYGIHFEQTRYVLYAGPVADETCAAQDPSYDSEDDEDVRVVTFPGNTFELVGVPFDVFFVPPDPTTYVCLSGNCTTPVQNTLVIRRVGASCTALAPTDDCRMLYVSKTGLISTE